MYCPSLKNIYQENIYQPLIENKRNFIIFFILMVVFAVLSYQASKTLSTEQLNQLEKNIKSLFAGVPISVWGIWKHNILVSGTLIILGILSFGLFPIVSLILQGVIIGFALGIVQIKSSLNPFYLILTLLPHGLFEIPAFLFLCILSIKLGWGIVRPRKNLTRWTTFKINFFNTMWSFLLVVIPLLLIAAVFEIYVSQYLIKILIKGSL